MDVACFSFVGRTLGAVATGLGLVAPGVMSGDGFDVATHLLEDQRWGGGKVVEAGLHALCQVLADEGLTSDQAEHALARLGDLVARYAADRDVLAGATTSRDGAGESSAAAAMTMAIVAAALRDGAWPVDLDPGLGGGVLDRVLAAVLSDRSHLLALARAMSERASNTNAPSTLPADPAPGEPIDRVPSDLPVPSRAALPVLVAAFEPPLSSSPAPRPARAQAEPMQPASPSVGDQEADVRIGKETGLTAVAVRAIRTAPGSHGASLSDSIVLERARGVAALASRLATDARDAVAVHKREAVAAIEAGAFAAADRAMSLAEDAHVLEAHQDLRQAGQHLMAAAELRLARAELAAVSGDFRRAARHMLPAIRCLPAGERSVRWHFTMRHGALLRAAGQDGDGAALHESAAAYRSAANEASAAGLPVQWARALSEWATTAIEITKATSDGRHAREAIAALEHALPALPRPSTDNAWALAQMKRGHAILLAGGTAPEPGHIAAAAEAFKAAMLELPVDRPSEARVEAQGWYGLALVRLAAATGDRSAADRAIPHLQSALGAPEFRMIFAGVAAEIAGALGDAAQAAGYRRGDVRLLETAVAAYRAALSDDRHASSPEIAGKNQEQLAACLWRLGELTGEPELLRQAAVALREAFNIAESQGENMRAGLLRGEFERLCTAIEAAMARTPQPVVHDAL